jgi:immune inhibitor A
VKRIGDSVDNDSGNQKIRIIIILGIIAALLPGLFLFTGDSGVHDGQDSNIIDAEFPVMDDGVEHRNNDYVTFQPNPEPFVLTQPDGTEFKGRMVGEVIGGHVETLDGYTIIEDDAGWWCYAAKDGEGRLVPTENLVGMTDPITISGIQKHLSNDHPEQSGPDSFNLDSSTRAPPLNATWKAIAIMLNFTDVDFDPANDKAHFEQLLNGTSGSTMRTYYREVSYGQFDIEVDVVGPFNSTHYLAWYGEDDHGLDTGDGVAARDISEMAREAVQLADPFVDFSQYDLDSDTFIDALFIIHAGGGQETSGTSSHIWSHKSSIWLPENVDGVKAAIYSTEPEDGKIGVFAHEFGHVLGLPDLYDTDYTSFGIGKWGVMAGGSNNGAGNSPAHFSAWSKVTLGWVEPIIVTSDISIDQIEIPPVWNNSVVYKMWAHDPSLNTEEYFLIENRQKSGLFESALPGDGILIWHIDEAQSTNTDETHYLVDLEEASGIQHLQLGSNQGNDNDPWEDNATGFNTSSTPNSVSYNGSATGVWVWNIGTIAGNGNMSVGFNEINTGPTGISLIAPPSSVIIPPVYDFLLNDTDFPDEDVGAGGSFIVQHSPFGQGIWSDTPYQLAISWIGGVGGIINCSGLPNGTWDFRVKITDEEGHVLYTNVITDVMIIDFDPPVANAGPDNSTPEDYPVILDASASTDNSGYLLWYNWTFGDGEIYNGLYLANQTVPHIYDDPGFYIATLNVSDAQGNWATDIVNITVYDATPPTTNLTISGPKFRAGQADDWNITQATTFTLSAYEEPVGTGLNNTWYTIDGQYFDYIGVPFSLTGKGEGSHVVTWGSNDMINNNETGNIDTVWIDETEPTSSLLIDSPRHPMNPDEGCNVTSTTTLTILGIDNPVAHGSGINFTWYKIEGVYFQASWFNLSGYGEGQYTINWGGMDNLGFNETGQTITVWIDDSAPATQIAPGNPRYPLAPFTGYNITSDTPITLLGVDEPATHFAGINFTWYTIDTDYYVGSAFNLSGYSEGQHTITWGSEDFLGNNETGNIISVWLDDSEPQTKLTMGLPRYPNSPYDGSNVTSSTTFNLAASDKPDAHNASISHIWYMIDGDYYEGTIFDLTGYSQGSHLITWGSQDNIGQNETNSIIVWLDDSTPVTVMNIGPEKHPDTGFDGCNVTAFTNFSLVPSDVPTHNAGVQFSWYTIDGEYFVGTYFDFTDYFEGKYTITWGSVDDLGQNETGNIIDVYVDRNSPTSTLEIGEPSFKQALWSVIDSTPFFINSSDSLSGVAFSWYTIDGDYYEGSSFDLAGYGEGIHIIYFGAQDNLLNNKTEIPLSVFVDMTPPNSTIEIGDPKYRDDPAHYWNVTGVTLFTILSVDDYSGIETAWYLIDDEYFEGAAFTMAGTEDGIHTIRYGARDRLGNNETANMTIVFADTHSPVTDYVFSGLTYRREDIDVMNITSDTTITLSGADNFTGLNYTWFTIDGIYGEDVSFNLSGYKEGTHIITWGSVDFAGNNETGNIMTVVLDDSPPFTEITMGTPRYRRNSGDEWNVTGAATFMLTAQENYTGIVFAWYAIDGIYHQGSEFNLSGFEDGFHTITWGAVDNMNHNESGHLLIVYLDDTAPSTTLSMGEPKLRMNENDIWNVTQVTPFDFVSSDMQSQVAFTWYTIDDEYHIGEGFLLSSDSHGPHTITYGAQDNLGNNETASSFTINLDRLPPVANITIGDMSPESGDRVTTNSSTPVNLYATDGTTGSGVAFIWYSLDGGITYQIYESYFMLDENMTSIIFGAQDLMGHNSTGINIRVTVDDREPVIEEPEEPEIVVAEPSVLEEIMDMFMDYLLFIIIIIIVLVLVVVLVKMRKKKEEPVAFETEEKADEPATTFVMEDEETAGEKEEGGEEKTITFEEEEKEPAEDAAVEWGE